MIYEIRSVNNRRLCQFVRVQRLKPFVDRDDRPLDPPDDLSPDDNFDPDLDEDTLVQDQLEDERPPPDFEALDPNDAAPVAEDQDQPMSVEPLTQVPSAAAQSAEDAELPKPKDTVIVRVDPEHQSGPSSPLYSVGQQSV